MERLHGRRESALPTCGLVYDLVYNPPLTRFMEQARENGVPAVNGMGMLIHQAGLSFRDMDGHTAPLEIMRKAVTSC